MAGNSFGNIFRVTTWGESHGKGIGVVIDGTPPLLELNEADIQYELDRRKPGQSNIVSPRKESDKIEILSGIFEGKTTGTPLAMWIKNENQESKDYSAIKNIFRPGHADFGYEQKYGIRDYRGGGRSSGRETAARVAAGAVAKKYLSEKGIRIIAYAKSIGNIKIDSIDFSQIELNPVRCPDDAAAKKMQDLIESIKNEGDSIGGTIEAVVFGVPAGLGDPVFDKLDACLAQAMLSIGGIKGIEFGDGFQCSEKRGSEWNDEFFVENKIIQTKTNHAGGILGGISAGNEIVFRLAVKPTPSISKQQNTVDNNLIEKSISITGRHDPCIVPRIVPVVEAMAALVIIDALLLANFS